MALATKDGSWIAAMKVTRIDCNKCGLVITTNYPTNDRETHNLLVEHANKYHGGLQ